MKFFLNIIVLFVLTSCSSIDFLLETQEASNFLKNKTVVSVVGWDKPTLNEVLFLKLGEANTKQYFLTTKVSEKQTKRSINENQVAQKIDYKIIISYVLSDSKNRCADVEYKQTSGFSFTPKSGGYNFASDVLLQKLFEEAVISNVDNFLSFADDRLKSYNCLDEN